MNTIEVSHVSKSFVIPHEKRNTIREWVASGFKAQQKDIFYALRDVSFTVRKGEFFGIIGRNGSGKSTLLKILAGIYLADAGKIWTKGRISPFLELGVGFNMNLSARDNVFLNGTILGLSNQEIKQHFHEIFQFAELEQFADQKLKNFSSGMQVRLAFSIAIQAKADLYFMDEVLAVGDMAFQKKCFQVFHQFKKEEKTLLLVSHNLEHIRLFCDRCLYLEHGGVAALGSTKEVAEAYANRDTDPDVDKSLGLLTVSSEVDKTARYP